MNVFTLSTSSTQKSKKSNIVTSFSIVLDLQTFSCSPVQSDPVLCLPDPEGLAPVGDCAGQHGLVDEVVLLLGQPVHALVVVQLDPQLLLSAPLPHLVRLLQVDRGQDLGTQR